MLLKNEPLENRQVLLTIRVDKEDWQRALQELYNDCSSLYPVEGCAPERPRASSSRRPTARISCIRTP